MTPPTDLAAFRGREIEQIVVRPLIAALQFGRFILPIQDLWPPSPWRWPVADLQQIPIDDWRVEHAVETLKTLNQGDPEGP